MNFADKLLMYMRTTGYTQDKLAELLGVSQAAVGTWVHGKSYPRKEHWEKIKTITGIDPKDPRRPNREELANSVAQIARFFHMVAKSDERQANTYLVASCNYIKGGELPEFVEGNEMAELAFTSVFPFLEDLRG